uniref:Elongation of very long chain fatty acids protein n=1 Tax=Tetranychus urticae TaxID=32264 RepID=T1L0G4_TETUR
MSTLSSNLPFFIPWESSSWIQWQSQNWTFVYALIILYLLSVRLGAAYMTASSPFDLRKQLVRWNLGLAIFSILGARVTVVEMISVLSNQGLYKAVCDNTFVDNEQVLFWNWLWTWSKLIEFGDTAFLVLRKKPLTFLHVYHHALTALWAFFFWHSGLPISRWTISMNFFVHSFMYTYFALAAYGVKIPKPVALFVTIIQILQMLIGCAVSNFLIYARITGISCKMDLIHDICVNLTYISYAILFIHMFYSKYLKKAKSIDSKNK